MLTPFKQLIYLSAISHTPIAAGKAKIFSYISSLWALLVLRCAGDGSSVAAKLQIWLWWRFWFLWTAVAIVNMGLFMLIVWMHTLWLNVLVFHNCILRIRWKTPNISCRLCFTLVDLESGETLPKSLSLDAVGTRPPRFSVLHVCVGYGASFRVCEPYGQLDHNLGWGSSMMKRNYTSDHNGPTVGV